MRNLLIILLLFSVALAFAGEMIPDKPTEAECRIHPKASSSSRNAPNHDVSIPPVDIQTSYYDYMPGSYIANPIHFQQNDATGGLYVTFHSRETASSTRRQYLAYINHDGTLNSVNYLSQEDVSEGYGSLDLDPVTGDPLIAYHVNFGLPEMTITGGYDVWHLLSSPGLISSPFNIVDNSEIAGVITPFEDDLFGWPYVFIMKSPTYAEDGKRRVFVFATNNTSHTDNPSENVLIAYTDYTTADIETGDIMNAEWTYTTIEMLDSYNAGPTWGRYQKGIAVTEDGKIGMIGYLNADDLPESGSEMLVIYNDNYGEGVWHIYEHESAYYLDNPENEDGSPYFEYEGSDIYFDLVNSSHPQAMFDADGRLHFIGNMVLGYMSPDDEHFLWGYYSYVKDIVFDPAIEEWEFKDLYPQSVPPANEYPYIPWDEDQDGEVDEYFDDGTVAANYGWPIWWHGWDEAFHENSYKFSANLEYNYYAAVWQDGLKCRYFNEAGDEDYADWATVPEIMISISVDGREWMEPIRLNANETPELEGMTPVYVYPADHIEYRGNGVGRIHLFFFDDNSFGSYIQGQGTNEGGMIKYMAVDVEFMLSAGDSPEIEAMDLQNYPNPFNPETNIRFDIPEHAQTTLAVYNVRGQLVKTLVNQPLDSGRHHAVWNGADDAGKSVSSGIYFYQLKSGDRVMTRKMVLIK